MLAIAAVALMAASARAISYTNDFSSELVQRFAEREQLNFNSSPCTNVQRAECYINMENMDPATCQCVGLQPFQRTPNQPVADTGLFPFSFSKDVNALATCWDQGKVADSEGQCISLEEGDEEHEKRTLFRWRWGRDPGSACNNASKTKRCYKLGFPCDYRCVCIDPPQVCNKCYNVFAIKKCFLQGLQVNPDCSCKPRRRCDCWDQWRCQCKGGHLDDNCNCVVPSSKPRWKRAATCPAGQKSCPVGGGKNECIDVQSNLESCGGCAQNGEGIDCTTLSGVNDVRCVKGECVASSCKSGFNLFEGGVCVQTADAVEATV